MFSDVLKRAPPPIDAPIALQLKHVLAACRIEAMQVVVERGWVHGQLTGEHGQDLGASVLADVQHATGVAGIAELRRVAGAGGSAASRRRACRSGPGHVIERGEFSELGALHGASMSRVGMGG